jgi:hypothetical protein
LIGACSDGSDYRPVDVLVTPQTDCFWVEYDKDKYNYGTNDDGATFWLALYSLPEDGARITFESAFPYARYMSLTSYKLGVAPIDALTDKEIIPDSGSTNPFVEGSPRNDPSRRYLVSIASGPPPAESSQAIENILYGGSSGAGKLGVLGYRVYVPNSGEDASGGVGVPRVTLHMADGGIVQGEDVCDVLTFPFEPPQVLLPADAYAKLRGAADPSRNPPVFRAKYSEQFKVQCDFGGDCGGTPPKETGAFANLDSDYMYSFLNRQYGEVVVLRGKIPETPKTLDGSDSVFMEQKLRYWSICPYEYYSTAVTECLFEEEVTINEDGFYTIVYSREEDRPNNVTSECGVGFIPWSEDGDGFGIVDGRESNRDDGYLLVRNMLPASDFDQAIHNTSVPGDEAEVMGEFLPKGKHFSKSGFEGLGCNPWLALPYEDME